MSNAGLALPPLPVLQIALRRITERLAHELAQPTPNAPDWSDFEWQLARAVAALHGVSPLLATNLKWKGPPAWRSFLGSQRAHVAARHQRIAGLLDQLDARSAEQGIAFVALKGAALHRMGLYRAGDRPMADIDLLVQPDQTAHATEVLESLGYSTTPTLESWKHTLFVPKLRQVHTGVGEHSQNYIKIELHERIAEALPLRKYDLTDSIYPRSPHPGLNAYPSRAALLTHLSFHAAGAMALRALRLLHLHDIALVAARMCETDWQELLAQSSHPSGLWWALPPVQLTVRYYPSAVPAPVLAELSDRCAWNLRRRARHQTLSDVSFSYLWIEAFPGIAWSQSLSEAAMWIKCRLLPDAQARTVRANSARHEVPIANSQWGHLSQRRRILRWMLSRQARPHVIHVVQTALSK
jgi:hypothetical protein